MDNMIVGLDLGYGQVKAIAENGQRVCFPSLVAPAESIRFQADLGAPVQPNGLTLYDTVDGDLFVGELAALQGRPGTVRNPKDRDRVSDPIVTHLTDAAFAKLLPGETYVRAKVMTGLPVDYFRDADRLVKNLRGQHHVQTDSGKLVVDVDEVYVVPQPFGALMSLLLDERGKQMADVDHLGQGRVGVLDIGTFTTDLILVNKLRYIEVESESIEVGVSTALEMLRKVLLDEYRTTCEYHQLEDGIRCGWLVISGERVHLNGLAGDHLSAIVQSIDAHARTLWNIGTLSAIVLAGGGALALEYWLEPYFKQAIRAPDAAMANVTGFLRYGLRKWR